MSKTSMVSARISGETENFLKKNFRSKHAGAEFILAWGIRAIKNNHELEDSFLAYVKEVLTIQYNPVRKESEMR